MHPPSSPLPEWRALLEDMCKVATDEYRRIVFNDPDFIKYFHMVQMSFQDLRPTFPTHHLYCSLFLLSGDSQSGVRKNEYWKSAIKEKTWRRN